MGNRSSKIIYGSITIIVLIALYFSSVYNYLVFHTLAEFFSVLIGVTIFLITMNSMRFLKNNYLINIGISFVFIAFLDVFHTLSYPEYGLLSDMRQLPNQLWIAARLFESLVFLFSFRGFKRKRTLYPQWLFLIYFLVTAGIFTSVLVLKNFPITLNPDGSLSTTMILAESLIIILLLLSIYYLFQYRDKFEAHSFRLLTTALVLLIASELAFSLYVGTYDLINLIGHYLRILSFYFIYKVMIVKVIEEPQEIIFRELNKEKELVETQNELLRNLAVLDGLTGLHNHRYIYERLGEEIKHFLRYRTVFSVLMVDIDHFKSINDTFGHLTGDAILKELGDVLKTCVRGTDLVGRFGGEEFLVVLESTGGVDALGVAEKIRKEVENHVFSEKIHLTISIGVSSYLEGLSVNDLIDQADKNLYEAKRNGRNQTVYKTRTPRT